MEKGKMRSSNMELLRSVAMLMIVLYHIVCHCVNIQLTDRGSMERMANGLFNHPLFYKKLMILDVLNTFGIVGNVVFILISGYFMAEKKGMGIDIVEISKKLLYQLGFASIVLTIASTVCFRVKSDAFFRLIDIQVFNSMSWFAGYYYAVMLIAKLFLNDFLERIDHRGYVSFLTVNFAFVQFGWTGSMAESFVPDLRTLLTGTFLYALGGYFKKYDPLSKLRTFVFPLTIMTAYFFVVLSAYNSTATNIGTYIRNKTEDDFIQNIPWFANYSIIIIIIGICLFELFRRAKISQSRVLNALGQSTFMVYLLHDNEFFYSIFDLQDWITLLYYHPFRFISTIFIWSLGVFACGAVTYAFYFLLVKVFHRYHRILFVKGEAVKNE